MKQFGYQRVTQAADAMRLQAATLNSHYLGGGTNLVDLMKLGVATPDLLVDVTELPYDFVSETEEGGLQIGATVRNSVLAAHPDVRGRYPALSQALIAGASGQLRNLATVAGNLLQRTRCPYFQDVTKPCNKRDPHSGCPAREGEHRNLAILGASDDCVATHPSDMAVALMALDAVVHVQDSDGPRQVPLGDFYRLPGSEPHRDTTLRPGTLITAVALPPPLGRSRYRKVRERASYAFAIGSVAAVLAMDGDTVRDARIALGAVAAMPWRATRAEDALRGRRLDDTTARAAAAVELEHARPLRDNGYKVPLLTELIARTLLQLREDGG
jgi:xanthine dehydrogenase YagS FAD-binding subunit